MDLDEEARGWVNDTISGMSLDEKLGQLIGSSFFSEFVSSDSGTYDALVELVHEYHVGGMLVFGTRQVQPDVLLNRAYTRNIRGQPLNAASLINRLQSIKVYEGDFLCYLNNVSDNLDTIEDHTNRFDKVIQSKKRYVRKKIKLDKIDDI